MKRSIGIYLRLSKAEKRGNVSGSIERQRLLLWDWIDGQMASGTRHGEKYVPGCKNGSVAGQDESPVLEYVDDGYSGMTENRPGYERLLGGVLTGTIGTVLVKDFSRLSRNHLLLAELRERVFPLHDVRLVAPGDGYDSLYDSGEELGYSFRSLFYEYYCHDISKKVKDALQAKKESGEYATGAVPYGYKNINGTWYIQPEEADILRFLFGEVAAGKSYRKAGEAVGMDAARVWYLLHNPVYLGQQVWHRYENHIGRQKKTGIVRKEDWNIRERAHEAIIDEELFQKIQRKSHVVHKKSVRENIGVDGRIYKDRHIFSGITKCRNCGRALSRGRRKKDMLCCRHCSGKEEHRITIWELLEICLAGVIEQYMGIDIKKWIEQGKKICEMEQCGDRSGRECAGSTEMMRLILRQLFWRIEVDRQGNVWICWNFTEDDGVVADCKKQ